MVDEYKISCGLPVCNEKQVTDSLRWSSADTQIFELKNGYIGQCPGDAVESRERVEIRGEHLAHNNTYLAEFNIQFDVDTTSEKGTKFFQIHQYNVEAPCDEIAAREPIFMLSIHGKGLVVTGQPLKEPNENDKTVSHGYCSTKVTRKQLAKMAYTVKVQFSLVPSKLNEVKVCINGQEIIDCKAWVACTGAPYLKYGLYRKASNSGQKNPTDRVTISQFSVITL